MRTAILMKSQFYYSPIKTWFYCCTSANRNKSQFYYSPIKTTYLFEYWFLEKSQFYYSPIKTVPADEVEKFIRGLNSIIVLLKLRSKTNILALLEAVSILL